jgi:hypothetical protein
MLVEILKNIVKITKETHEIAGWLSDDGISGLFAGLNTIPQLTYKKTATPKIIGVAVGNVVINTLLMPHNLLGQIFNGQQIARSDDTHPPQRSLLACHHTCRIVRSYLAP